MSQYRQAPMFTFSTFFWPQFLGTLAALFVAAVAARIYVEITIMQAIGDVKKDLQKK